MVWPEEWLWCICGNVCECCGVLWRFVYGVVVCVVVIDCLLRPMTDK